MGGSREPELSSVGVTLRVMEVLAEQVDEVPVRNLRVPLSEFVTVWVEAERRADADPTDWFAVGVVNAARWIARASYPVGAGRRFASSPMSGEPTMAHEELIEAELLIAERLATERRPPPWVADRPGWLDGVLITLRWAWLRMGPDPFLHRT